MNWKSHVYLQALKVKMAKRAAWAKNKQWQRAVSTLNPGSDGLLVLCIWRSILFNATLAALVAKIYGARGCQPPRALMAKFSAALPLSLWRRETRQ